MNTSSPAIQIRIGPRVSAFQLVIVSTVFVVGLLTGLVLAQASIRPASASSSSLHRTVLERGPQSHVGDMIELRSQLLGHHFRPSANHRS